MTWIRRHSPFDSNGEPDAFAASPTLVVASGFGPNPDYFGMICTSPDGITWTESPVHPFIDGWPECLCWADGLGLFLAGGYSGSPFTDVLATSPDGITWTARTTPLDGDEVGGICWSPELGLLCAVGVAFVGPSSRSVITSPDGITWTLQTTSIDGHFGTAVCWSSALGLFCAITGFGEVITSPDGITWTLQTTPLDVSGGADGFEVSWAPTLGLFVALGQESFSGPYIIIVSADGITWTTADTPVITDRRFSVSEINDGQIMAASRVSGAEFLLTSDGYSWIPARTPFSGSYSVGYSPTLGYAILGGNGSTFPDIQIVTGTPTLPRRTPETDTTQWRYLIAALDGSVITDFSKISSNRVVQVVLNAPLSMSGQVASSDPQVYIPYDDAYDDPYLNEGTRLVWGLRRESNFPPYYVARAAAICQLLQDAGQQDDATTTFQGWDPWHYMFSRPVVDINGLLPSQQPGKKGISWNDTKVSVIICELLRNTILNHGHAYIDAGAGNRIGEGSQYQDWEGTFNYGGTLDALPVIDWNIDQDISVGQAWQELTAQGFCDIVLTPVYEPFVRANMLVEMNVLVQAGSFKPEAMFAWDMPGRSLVGINRQYDGSVRANEIALQAGSGGKFGRSNPFPVEDPGSVAKYGQYWEMQSYPEIVGSSAVVAVTSLALEQLHLRSYGRQTVTFTPAPERSPRPWQDYGLGDQISVFASGRRFRQLIGAIDTWTPKSSALGPTGATYGAGGSPSLFVVVGQDAFVSPTIQIVTSDDQGETWTSRTSDLNYAGAAVVYAAYLDLWVVGGYNDPEAPPVIVTSADNGVTWDPQPGCPLSEVDCLAVSPDLDLIVAGGFSGPGPEVIATSPDGITWTAQSSPADGENIQGLAWSNVLSLFVAAVGPSTPGPVMTSPDGVTWTVQTTPLGTGAMARGRCVCWAPQSNVFVMGATTSGGAQTIIRSVDGITWTTATTPATTSSYHAIGELADGSILTGGFGSPTAIISRDGGLTFQETDVSLGGVSGVATSGVNDLISGDSFTGFMIATKSSFGDSQYQRIYGWTANISDDALETIDPVLVSPGQGT